MSEQLDKICSNIIEGIAVRVIEDSRGKGKTCWCYACSGTNNSCPGYNKPREYTK
ncbi:MAG TPA: hypothetical protein VMC80_02775 [Patescibacteria group bacterium]|nr:hypothetical protein [Patescibacteria group bacterium]